jgi:hypothetical protein
VNSPKRPPSPKPGAGRVRTGPPASARLTIKPAAAERRSIALPPRPRPSGTRRLSEVELDEDEILAGGFDAVLNGESVRITAVLERTCVYVDKEGDRRLAGKNDVWVEADKLPIQRRGFA